jgi:hypothetical protein
MERAAILVFLAVMVAGCASNNLPELPPAPMGEPAPPPAEATARDIGPRTLKVGPTEMYLTPSDAAARAFDGDTVVIDAGHYHDCSVWKASNLTIQANGDGDVVIDGAVCEGKGLLVIKGDNVSIRGITFRGAAAGDGNGAGIREEGDTLTVEDSTFLDNQDGILAMTKRSGTVIIRHSRFEGNGACIGHDLGCSHGIYVGTALLRVENSTFRGQHAGHHIKSKARRTELTGNTIEDGRDGTSSYLVDVPDGGSLIMRDNILEKGPKSQNPCCAISIGAESASNPTDEIVLENNSFKNDFPGTVIFLRNLAGATPTLSGNTFSGRVVPVSGS